MPFKFYHGRTGVVFNVNKRAVGVRVNKEVNGRIVEKLIHVAVPHVRPSKCRDEIIRRRKENEAAKAAVRNGGGKYILQPFGHVDLERVCLKRQPAQPKKAYFVAKTCEIETIQPTPYIDLV